MEAVAETAEAVGSPRILLVAAHPSDEFGVAATLRRHARTGNEVFAAWLARDDRRDVQRLREAEARQAMSIIDVPLENLRFPRLPSEPLAFLLPAIVDEIRRLIARIKPDVVYVPAYEGGHPDHDAVTAEQILANLTENANTAKSVLRAAARRLPTPRDCECATALKFALVTRPDLVPDQIKKELAPIIRKYMS